MKTALSAYLNSRQLIGNISKLVIVGLSISCVSLNKLNMDNNPTAQPNYIEGIDISHHQGIVNWAQLTPANSGKQFIIVKATEGATYQDPRFIENCRNILQLGFDFGTYHYLRFGTSTPKDQMNNFIHQLNRADSSGRWREHIIALKDYRIKSDKDTIAKTLTISYRQEHLFSLKQEFEFIHCISIKNS